MHGKQKLQKMSVTAFCQVGAIEFVMETQKRIPGNVDNIFLTDFMLSITLGIL